MMNGSESLELIGTTGTYRVDARFSIQVRILDTRTAYGNDQLQVTPVAGEGTAWVMADRVKGGG